MLESVASFLHHEPAVIPGRKRQDFDFQQGRLANLNGRRGHSQLKNPTVTVQLPKLTMRSVVRRFDPLRDIFQLEVALLPNLVVITTERKRHGLLTIDRQLRRWPPAEFRG